MTACCETESKTHIIPLWFPIVSTSYTIDRLEICACLILTDLYLECSYEDLLCIFADRKNVGFLLPFSYRLNKKLNITFRTLCSGKH